MSKQQKADFETAFIVKGRSDGTFVVTTVLDEPFTIARPASRLDIKRACRELYDRLVLEEIITSLK